MLYLCIYPCMYICTCVAHMCIYRYLNMDIYIFAPVHKCTYVYICSVVNVQICTFAEMQPWIYACMSILYVYMYVRICTHVYVCVYLYACLLVWCMHVSVMMWICMTCEYVWHVNMWQWAYWDAFSRVASGIPSEKQLIAEIWVLWVDVTTSVWLPGDLFDLFDPEAFWRASLLSRGHTTFRSKTWLFKGPNTANTS